MDKSCLKSNGQNLLEVGMTRLLTYRQCCKFSRHGCWIKLTPAMGATLHSKWDCSTSPTRLRQGSNELEHVGRCKQGLMSLIRRAVEASYLSRDQERMQHVTCFLAAALFECFLKSTSKIEPCLATFLDHTHYASRLYHRRFHHLSMILCFSRMRSEGFPFIVGPLFASSCSARRFSRRFSRR
jgi:hypothetical protein